MEVEGQAHQAAELDNSVFHVHFQSLVWVYVKQNLPLIHFWLRIANVNNLRQLGLEHRKVCSFTSRETDKLMRQR